MNPIITIDPSVDPSTPQNSVPVSVSTPTVYTIDQVNQEITNLSQQIDEVTQSQIVPLQTQVKNWQDILAQITPAVATFIATANPVLNTVAPLNNATP